MKKILIATILLMIVALTLLRAEGDATTTFTGAASDYWHVLANWTNGLPNSTKDAVIDHNNCIVVSYTEQAKDLTINNGSTLRIYSTVLADTLAVTGLGGTVLLYGEGDMTIADTIINDGMIILDSHLGGFVKTNNLYGDGAFMVEEGTLYFNHGPIISLNKDCDTVSRCLPGE